MPKRQRELADAQRRVEARKRSSRRDRLHGEREGMDHTELLALVCKYFCKGCQAAQIVAVLREKHGVKLTREEPYQFLAYAASRGWITFTAPHAHALREEFKKRYGWLHDVEVVHTSVFDDVALHAAGMLVEMLQQARVSNRQEVHVGFAGGHAMRKLAQALGRLLRTPTEGLPRTVVFQAMVAGFDVDVTTDPNSFFLYFLDDPAMQVSTRFVGLRAPALIKTQHLRALRKLPGIEEAFKAAGGLDIIVTSAGSWQDPHSQLKAVMSRSKKSMEVLEKAGVMGDMLWRPLGPEGPIEERTETRAMTVKDLSDLPAFIENGKKVLLVLGPCGGCGRPKDDILKVILSARPPLISHLVVDTRSARAILS